MARTRAMARLLRASNLPSVFSNSMTGAAIGAAAIGRIAPPGASDPLAEPAGFPLVAAVEHQAAVIGQGLLIGLGVTTFYLAGAILNDVFDIRWDRRRRPDRPLASGLVGSSFAVWAAAVLIVVGIGWAWSMGPRPFYAGLALLAVVLAYDAWHKKFVGSVVFMGLARGGVIVLAALVVNPEPRFALLAPIAGLIAAYTALFTLIARGEHEGELDGRRWLAAVLPLLVLALVVFVRPAEPIAVAVVLIGALTMGWLALAAWRVLQSPPRTPKAVGLWLTGLCVIDGWCLALLGAPIAGAAAVGLAGVMLCLQRLAPGT